MGGVSLYDYQEEALEKMRNGCVLCGGVGSGKSRTGLAYYYIHNGGEVNTGNYVRMTEPIKNLVIITTARKRDTAEWEEELIPFKLSPDRKINLYKNVVMIDSWNNIKRYVNIKGAFFIFDEQRVVGNGVWVRNFLKIAANNEWIMLSATPGDTWLDYIPLFVANGFYKNRTEFLREHVVFSRFSKYPKVEKYLNVGRLTRLRDRILVNMNFNRMLRAHHYYINCEYDISTYKEIMKRRWNMEAGEPIKDAAELCRILRKLVNLDTSRFETFLDLLSEHPRVILFYNFDYELYALVELLESIGYPYSQWNGHKHQDILAGSKWVYLVQYTAGAEGWNCTTTDTIIFFSQSYSYKIMTQAAGRIDRLNTPYMDLYYYHLKSKSSIDTAIYGAYNKKKNFNERRFIDGGK